MVPSTEHYLRFERVLGVERTPSGVLVDLGRERLRVDVVRDDVVRFMASRGGRFDEQPTHAVCVDPLGLEAPFEVEEDDDAVRVRTAGLVVTVHLDPFRLDVHRPDGSPVVETAQDADGRWWPYAVLNDSFVLRRRSRPDDALLGLGEKTGTFERGGRDFALWNTDVLDQDASARFHGHRPAGDPRADPTSTEFDPYYMSIPLLYHQRWPGGAVSASFIDNGYRLDYDLSDPREVVVHGAGGHWCEYVFAGPAMRDVIEAYTWLTGRASLPPLWALGYHQSRWHAYTQPQVEALAQRHRELEVPCDGIWLDIEYMDGYRVFTWDEHRFPDPRGMLERLRDQGFRVVTIIDPGVKHDPGYAVFDDAVAQDVLCRTENGDLYVGQVWPGDTVFPDFATPEARAWWGRLNAEHLRSGLAGIWNDMNEPATGRIPPDAMRFDHGAASHERFHNQYALLMAMGTVEGLRAEMPELRTFVLSRAGSPGIQRYAANWMGDNLSRWDHLALSMPMAAGLGISGQPFVGADVGGFFGSSNAELFVRWMQYGALTPFFRNHSAIGNVDQYAWAFGDVVLGLVREAVRLRYRLMPYLYAAFVEATRTGLPVQRPLVLEFQDDPLVRGCDDQFLLGRDLLVAPVTAQGMTSRQVYLPPGDWFDLHTDERLEGGRFVVAPTPMDRIPLFVRAGAVLPQWPEAPPSTDGYRPEVLELHVYAPADGDGVTSTFQEDDGVTTAAERGALRRTTLEARRDGTRLVLRAAVEGDGFDGDRRTGARVVVHGVDVRGAVLDGDAVAVGAGALTVPHAGGFELVLELG